MLIRLDDVLACCRYRWEDHNTIAARYDTEHPPRFYEFERKRRLRELPGFGSVQLYAKLDQLCRRGLLTRRKSTLKYIDMETGVTVFIDTYWHRLKPNGGQRVRVDHKRHRQLQPA